MKTFAAATLVALASVATAQLDNIPQCALSCFLEPLQSDGCSQLTDFKCHCEKADSLFAAVIPCVQGACSADEQQTTLSAVEETCKAAGVPVEVPVPGGGASSAPASSAPAETSAPAQSSAAESAAPTSGGGAASSAVSSALSSIAESASSVLATATATGGNGTAPTGTGAPTQFTGAAAQATQAAAVLGAAALALMAL